MKKDVIIYVKGEQYYEGVDPDGVELMTEGTMTVEEDAITLAYEETELTGMEGTTTTFRICGDTVTLTRSGRINSQMIFQEDRPHSSLYTTPWGQLEVDITTQKLLHRITERGGVMEIRYTIAVGHQVTGRNQYKVRVREKMR